MSRNSNQISFGDDSSGPQFGINNGTIYVSSDRTETSQQRVDNSTAHSAFFEETFTYRGAEILRSLAFPQMLDRRENVEPCHINTCEWILDLEKYQSWRNESRGLFWIKGKPGAGKSTLMLFLHGKLKGSQNDNHGIQLDFFFTARGTEMQRTPLGMLRSLLNQLFDRDATVRAQVREAYKQRARLFGQGEGKWEWAQPILEELLASVILAAASRQHVTLFVDALDEAGEDSARRLATYFHRLIDRAKQKNVTLRICISCRHYPIVESDQAVEIHIEQHNHKDIAAYITDTLAGADVEENLSEETKETLAKQLIQQANGIFQWARLIVPAARKRISEAESFDEICRWLREVPADLEGVYMCILNDVIEARNLEQSFLLFQWVCLAERPLSVVEMRYALAAKNAHITRTTQKWESIDGFIESDKRMKGRIKALSGGLAEVILSEDASETVQVVHQSVNDFLREKGLAALNDRITTSSEVLQTEEILSRCQANIYRSCLVYLALQCVRGDIPSDPKEAKQGLKENHPLLDYATVNLFIHAEKAAHSRVLILPNEQDVLHQMIEQWVQNYQTLYRHILRTCPARGTTVIHMAAAANLVDIIERLPSDSEDVTRKDEDGNTPFHLAARYGQIKAGRCLREKRDNSDEPNIGGTTPLIEAARYGHAEFVEWILLECVKLEGEMGQGESALYGASKGGHQKVVGVLIAAGANVNTQGGQFGNALQAASTGESIEIVQMLLNAGADINAHCGHCGTALQSAARSGTSPEILQMLLDAGADVNAQGGEHGNALQAAAAAANCENSEIVQILLDAGADVDAQGGYYGNALQAAAAANCENNKTVAMLLDAGVDVNAQGGEYGNALQAAAAALSKNSKTVAMLLDAGADVNAQGGYYGNALQAAAPSMSGNNSEIVQMLLDAGADVNAQGGKYGNALQAAAAVSENCQTVAMLLDAGADVNAQGGEYGNALQAAATDRWIGNNKIVQILLSAGADVNAWGGRFGSSLLASVHEGLADQIEMLLQAGANVLLADELDQTPLHIAALNNRLDVLRQCPGLLSPINNRDKLSRTPLHLAITFGHIEVAMYLLQFGANPSLLDGYGRNTLDWVVGNESLVHQIRGHHPSIVLTPDTTQELAVRRSIRQISDTLLQSQLDCPWPLLQQLGRYLLFVNKLDDARCLFQLHLSQRNASGNPMYEVQCVKCEWTIYDSRFVCTICAHMDLCPSCERKYRFHSRLHPNQEHKTIEVPHVRDRKYLLSALASKKLRSIVEKYSAPEAHGSGERPSYDFMSCLLSAPEWTSAFPMTPLRPITIFCLLMLGILPTLILHLYCLVENFVVGVR
ncbi:unnamed protein product [Penicillium salamii]|uniref:NACHT domain-containing protein n=1 Tax=Penicillium salamii TaxID=1612424 RepID=A0A9W4JM02_9EURO|nr:unnamed protein product [Penicillium salamii]CAG8062338.1 unnamed protein product [Penicillium salamii]CAG8139919.1 unnamed protein product [Penicillium salamii]CAG8149405.1 unnamed protein product [Penicillium salamii]CAG8157526.1 unnamed protein product [Penicillium salamii]